MYKKEDVSLLTHPPLTFIRFKNQRNLHLFTGKHYGVTGNVFC